nr:hypothetical protein [Tanacetum cinerariifolium]
MHNNIMTAGFRDRPPMLATGRYAQWQSRFLRYIDTRLNDDALRKCILEGPYTPSTVTILDIPAIYQKEVNKSCVERIAKNANLLALVVAQQYPDPYYLAPKSHKSYETPLKKPSSTRSNASTKHKDKEIAKPITPLFESASEEDSDPEQAQRDKDMQKNLELIAKYFKKIYKATNNNLRTSSDSRNKNVNTSLRKPKRVKDYSYHKEKMLLCKQAEKGVPLQAEQIQEVPTTESRTNTQPLEQVQYNAEYNVFANKRQHFEKPKSLSNTCVVEKVDSNGIPDSSHICDNDIQTDQNAKECDDERVTLVNLIENLKLDVDENKKIQKQLKKLNTSLAHELKECTSILAETSRTLGESNTIRDSCLIALQNKETELETYKTLNDR